MELSDFLRDVRDDKAPKNWFITSDTTRSDVLIFGPDHLGISIPIIKIDEVIAELRVNYQDPAKTYKFKDLAFKLPGSKVPLIIEYLKEVVKVRERYGTYKRTFG